MSETSDSPETTCSDADVVPWENVKLLEICISSGHDYWGKKGEGRMQHGIMHPDEVDCVAGMGLRDDRYFGRRPGGKGQVTFFDMEVVEQVRLHFKLPELPASVFRRNLIVRGEDLSKWLGKRFMFQGVEFEGAQECKPCDWMNRVVEPGCEEFLKLRFRGGLRARILTDGMLRVDG